MSSTRLTRRAVVSPRTLALFFVIAGLGWTLLPRLSDRRDAPPHTSPQAAVPQPDASAPATPAGAFGNLPLSFEANDGQTSPEVKFLARGSGYRLFLTRKGAVIQLRNVERGLRTRGLDRRSAKTAQKSVSPAPQTSVLRMSLVGANEEARVEAEGELPGKSNYLTGDDPSKWRTNVAHFSRVRYEEVYPGVELVYYGNQRRLEYDFRLAPGSDPNAIRLAFGGAQRVSVDEETGDLLLETAGGALRQHRPFIFQEVDGGRREVAGRYRILETPSTKRQTQTAQRKAPPSTTQTPDSRLQTPDSYLVGFEVAEYDSTLPLVIDPVLSYATYLGGTGGVNEEQAAAVAVDSFGNAYVTGSTDSPNFPTKPGSFDTTLSGTEAFVTKLNATGTALIYSTFIGGGDSDGGAGIALDANGNAYVTGSTISNDFPIVNGFKPTNPGGGADSDGYLAKLNANGTALLYSTYIGGGVFDSSEGVAVDSAGNAYVVGNTDSTDLLTSPAPPASFDNTTFGPGEFDGFLLKINTRASGAASLVYGTYVGGSGDDFARDVAVDAAGNACVVGSTEAADFPTFNPQDGAIGGTRDLFVLKLNAAGSALVFSTFLGGAGVDSGDGVALDPAGNVYAAGTTNSTDFPVSGAAAQGTSGGLSDATATKYGPTGLLSYSTYLGGAGSDVSADCAVDSNGNFYLTGQTDSTNFPTANALQAALDGGGDGFVSKLNAAGSAFVYSTYLGGGGVENGADLALDDFGNAYVVGSTDSTDFPTTAGAFQTASSGVSDAFVTRLAQFGSCSAPSYSAASGSPFTTGDAPRAVAVGDFDRDGHADLAVANAGTGDSVSILMGNGNGTFDAALNVPLTAGTNPSAIAVADFNLDGFQDIATANSGNASVTVLLNDGTGAAYTAADFVVGTNPLSIVASDWDGDGDPDLATANFNDDNLSILKSDGLGSFPTTTTAATGDGPRALAAADFDLDGDPDIVVAEQNTQTVPIRPNDGAATFAVAVGSAAGGPPVGIAVADFNLDGFPDAATANGTAQNVTVLLGNGGASFASTTNFAVAGGSNVNAIAAGDFNNDNRPDVAVVNGANVSVLLGNGAGSLGAATATNAGAGDPTTLAPGDFNEDTRPDFAAANPSSDNAPVILSGCGLASSSTLVVNSANDVNDGTCNASHCSLREAINASNATVGTTETITFNIPGAGVRTIAPTSVLPNISDAVTIDGYTQPGASVNTLATGENAVLLIELDGTSAGANMDGLRLVASGSTVRGLVVNRFKRHGIALVGATGGGDNNTVTGNFLGTDPTGMIDLGNSDDGVGVETAAGQGSDNNTIGGTTPAARNVISGNVRGVGLINGTGNVIRGNFIGLAADGTTMLGNVDSGVTAEGPSSGTVIGGDDAADGASDGVVNARNYISGNGNFGVVLGAGGAGFTGRHLAGQLHRHRHDRHTRARELPLRHPRHQREQRDHRRLDQRRGQRHLRQRRQRH